MDSSNFASFASKKLAYHSNKPNLVSSLRPFYFFSRAFGLLPFSVKFDTSGEIQTAQVSGFDVVWFGISISIHFFLIFAFFQIVIFSQDPSASYVLYFGNDIFNLAGLIFGIITMIMDMCNRSKLVEILKGFTNFDKEASCTYFKI